MDWTALRAADRRPRPFAEGDGLFWADPYVASHVVWAHGDDRSDDASRPLRQIRAEVAWIDALAPARGNLLDLGCGIGRHALLLGARGWRVTGIDAAEPSLAVARQEAADAGLELSFHHGDLRRVGLPGRQNLILIAYGTLGTLSPAQAAALVRRCRRALAPGGLLVFDLFRRPWFDRQLQGQPDRTWDVVAEAGFWSPDPHLVLTRTDAYPELRTFARTYVVADGTGVRRFPFWYRWYDPDHLPSLLPGWTWTLAGGLDGRRLSAGSPWFAVAARPEE